MSGFLKGVFVGVGIGLLIAPMPGEEMRRMVRQRYQQVRGYLPADLDQYVQQVTDRVSQTTSNVKGQTQQAATKLRETGSDLGTLARRSAREMKQTSQDVASTTKQAAKSMQQSTTTPDEYGDAVDLTMEY